MTQEKTEKATPKKLQDARDRGEIPRSKELPTVTILVFAFAYFLLFGGEVIDSVSDAFRHLFTFDVKVLNSESFDPEGTVAKAATSILKSLLIFFAMCIGIAIVANCGLGGFIFSGKKLIPDFTKLSPMSGFKRIFSMQQVVELIKSILKALLVLIPLYMIVDKVFYGFGAIRKVVSPIDAFEHVSREVVTWGLVFSSIFVVIVLIDVPYQIYSFNKKNMMSRQEIKEEYKNSEGNPEIKAKRRQLQFAMSRKAANNRVQEADIIITNPTHYAVGLKFDMGDMEAPQVVALGADNIALAIRAKAAELQIPVLEIPPLARVLYKTTEVGQEIPFELYQPVATVIGYIYQLNDRLAFDISDEFIKNLNIDESAF